MVTLSVGNWYIQVSGLSVTRSPYTYSLPHVFSGLQVLGVNIACQGASKKSFFLLNPHGDKERLLDT